jgi:hypothetical protein
MRYPAPSSHASDRQTLFTYVRPRDGTRRSFSLNCPGCAENARQRSSHAAADSLPGQSHQTGNFRAASPRLM